MGSHKSWLEMVGRRFTMDLMSSQHTYQIDVTYVKFYTIVKLESCFS